MDRNKQQQQKWVKKRHNDMVFRIISKGPQPLTEDQIKLLKELKEEKDKAGKQ